MKVARIAGASRHSRLETEPRLHSATRQLSDILDIFTGKFLFNQTFTFSFFFISVDWKGCSVCSFNIKKKRQRGNVNRLRITGDTKLGPHYLYSFFNGIVHFNIRLILVTTSTRIAVTSISFRSPLPPPKKNIHLVVKKNSDNKFC